MSWWAARTSISATGSFIGGPLVGGAVAGDVAVEKSGVEVGERFVVGTEGLGRAGPKTGEDDINVFDEVVQERPPVARREVEGERLLAVVARAEVGRPVVFVAG